MAEHPTASPRQSTGPTQNFFRAVNNTPSIITLGSEKTSFKLIPGKAMLFRTTPLDGLSYSSIPVAAENTHILGGSVLLSAKELSELFVPSGDEKIFHFHTRDHIVSKFTGIEEPKSIILAKDNESKSGPEKEKYNQWLSDWSHLLCHRDPFQPNNSFILSSKDIHQWVRSLLDLPENTIFIR